MRSGLLPEARKLVLPDGIKATSGPRVIATAAKVGLALDPWQEDIARLTFTKLSDSALANDYVCISVPRQAGKTYLVGAMIFAECLITKNTTVAWTAHHNKVMLETFNTFKQYAKLDKLAPHIKDIKSGAEDRSIHFTNGSRITMAARESGALRGIAKVRILVLDEAQILSESAMSDILPTQNAAVNPLTIMLGTPPKPKDQSEVFRQQRELALEAEKTGEAPDRMTWIEIAADSDADTDDPEQLRKANPSYPHRTNARAIKKLRNALSEDSFRREALGIWDDAATPAVIPNDIWTKLADAESKALTKLVLAVDVSPDRATASVSLAGYRADGSVHIELDEARSGASWVVDWIVERCAKNPIVGVVIDAKGPASSFIKDLKAKKVPVIVTSLDDVTTACADFFDATDNGTVHHTGQTQLTRSLNSARKRAIGDRWAWNRKSPDSDITPIVAATLAHWGVLSRRVRATPKTNSRRATIS